MLTAAAGLLLPYYEHTGRGLYLCQPAAPKVAECIDSIWVCVEVVVGLT